MGHAHSACGLLTPALIDASAESIFLQDSLFFFLPAVLQALLTIE
jgi:hypothetical protein